MKIFSDRADTSRRRLGGIGREQPRVKIGATGHAMHHLARGLEETNGEECLEDCAEHGKGGRHCERSMHASLDQAKILFRTEWNRG